MNAIDEMIVAFKAYAEAQSTARRARHNYEDWDGEQWDPIAKAEAAFWKAAGKATLESLTPTKTLPCSPKISDIRGVVYHARELGHTVVGIVLRAADYLHLHKEAMARGYISIPLRLRDDAADYLALHIDDIPVYPSDAVEAGCVTLQVMP